jgi:hypothetical protein
MIKDIYYVPCLDINFNDNRCFIFDKNRKKMVAMGVEEQGLF